MENTRESGSDLGAHMIYYKNQCYKNVSSKSCLDDVQSTSGFSDSRHKLLEGYTTTACLVVKIRVFCIASDVSS